MMVLNASQGHHKDNMVSKPFTHRRRRSKGTIAGFASQAASAEAENLPDQTTDNNTTQNNTVPQHAVDNTTSSPPCHSSRLTLLCIQNSLSMGAKTQLALCPPGRNRRSLQVAMRNRHRNNRSKTSLQKLYKANTGNAGLDSFYALEKLVGNEVLSRTAEQEEDYLLSTNTFDFDSEEEASSGDEDELIPLEEILSDKFTPPIHDEKKYEILKEPLFTPTGTETSASATDTNSAAGKLPFNYRKIRYFDTVTASERATARKYLTDTMRKSRKRDGVVLSRHLRRMHRRERRRQHGGVSGQPESSDDESLISQEEVSLTEGISRFTTNMTSPLSAAMLLESLTLNPVESVEGMAKCYDGIVAAGDALLGMDDNSAIKSGDDGKPKAGRAEVLQALVPLLISSLEKPSGEVVLYLAALRRMCGTTRYQRRFVQRVAPALIRPHRGAIWCLKHQNDMESILAAAELIFDSAHEIFSDDWYERGRQFLADSVRKETLNYAAQQLRDLSQESNAFGLSTHGHRRKLKSSVADSSGSALAEWEVRAVDLQIRISISNIVTKDWSMASISAKDFEMTTRTRRSSGSSATDRRQRSSSDVSHKSLSSPRSPTKPKTSKAIMSPQTKYNNSHGPPPAPDTFESVFGPSFASQPVTFSTNSSSENPDVPLSPTVSRKEESKIILNQEIGSTVKTPPRSPHSPPTTPSNSTIRESMRSPPPTHSDPLLQPPPISGVPAAPGQAPLSPQSSVGNISSSSDPPHHYRPVSSSSSVASVGSLSSQPAHYRMLTSTAAERKRTVAACRALRSQIQRFEEAFMQLHGRAPKGATERAPLATTYAQYREWKRAIRADAACRIQALFRGASTRWKLLRGTNARLARVVMARAGRTTFSKPLPQLSLTSGVDNEPVNLSPMPSPLPRNDRAIEVYKGDKDQTPPHWSSMQASRRGSGDRDFKNPSSVGYPSSPPPSANNPSNTDMSYMTLSELQNRKRDLKQQLKQYDMNFARKHGRMPVKVEKEPIRHLYETYNSLKTRITFLEKEGQHKHRNTPVTPPHSSNQSPQHAIQQPRSVSSQRTQSPPLGSSGSSGADSSGSEDLNPGPSIVRPKQRNKTSTPSTPPGAPSQDLAALKSEKTKLHQMLRSYEKDFFKEHKRQVSSFADIKPVASQYRRYKEIKKAIAALQQQGSEK